jgi:hypothetical protein
MRQAMVVVIIISLYKENVQRVVSAAIALATTTIIISRPHHSQYPTTQAISTPARLRDQMRVSSSVFLKFKNARKNILDYLYILKKN